MPTITVNSNKKDVLAAVKQDGMALQYASETLKNDSEVVLAAVKQNGSALYYASDILKKDSEVVLAAVAQNGSALYYASDILKKDREVVLAAVALDGTALDFASETLKKDQILQEVSKLDIKNSAAFLALEPLKTKLKQEANLERKAAGSKMISDMETALVSYYQARHQQSTFNLKEAFNKAIDTARPALEQQSGWKKIIDAVANAIMNCIYPKKAEQSQGKSTYHSFFFANPNPAAKEIEDLQATIDSFQIGVGN